MPHREEEVADLSLDDFRSVAARDDDPETHDAVPAEEDLHQVDPFVDPELAEVVDLDALETELAHRTAPPATEAGELLDDATEDDEAGDDEFDHEASIDEILDETTHSHDPAREIGWAEEDDEPLPSPAAAEATPERLHIGEFQCTSCFLVLPDRLRVLGRDPVVCIDCSAALERTRN